MGGGEYERGHKANWAHLEFQVKTESTLGTSVHGGMQRKGIDYWYMHVPVVNWSTVRLV